MATPFSLLDAGSGVYRDRNRLRNNGSIPRQDFKRGILLKEWAWGYGPGCSCREVRPIAPPLFSLKYLHSSHLELGARKPGVQCFSSCMLGFCAPGAFRAVLLLCCFASRRVPPPQPCEASSSGDNTAYRTWSL